MEGSGLRWSRPLPTLFSASSSGCRSSGGSISTVRSRQVGFFSVPAEVVSGRSLSYRLIDIARTSAIIALVGLLYSPTVASGGLIVTYVAFFLSGEARARMRQVIFYPPVYWGIAFLGVVVVGFAYGPATWQERWIDLLKWRTVLWFIVLFALFDDERWTTRLLLAFLIGTGVGLVASFAGVFGWVKLWKPPGDLLRNYVTQAMSFSISALLCFWMILIGRVRGREQWALALLGALFAGNVFFVTDSRSGYLVLGLGISVLLTWHLPRRQWGKAAAALVVGMTLLFFLSPQMQGKIYRGIDEWAHASESKELTSMGIRKVFYAHSVEIALNHFILGVGTGGFKKAYAEEIADKYSPSDWRSGVAGDPHNQYLAILVQHGMLGLLVFLIWIASVVQTKSGLPSYRGLALAILCGWCVTSLFSSHFRTFAEGHLLTTFLGVLLAVYPHHQSQSIEAEQTVALKESR